MTLAKKSTSHLLEDFILDSGLYVDDDSLVYKFLPPGARWCLESRRMQVKPEHKEEDLHVEEDTRTMIEVNKMADSICPELQTTFDCPGLHGERGEVLILDLQVWVERVEKEDKSMEWELSGSMIRNPVPLAPS